VFSSIILGAAIFSGFSYIAWQVGSFSLFPISYNNWMKKQMAPIKAEMAKTGVEIIRLPMEQWEEISTGYEKLTKKFSLNGIEVGVIKSIFHENLILIGKKTQLGFKNKFLMLVLVDDIELTLVGNANETQVFINEKKIGVINLKNLTYSTSTGVKASIKSSFDGNSNLLVVNEKKVAYLNKVDNEHGIFSTRLTEHIDSNYDEEFVRAMPLIIYYIIRNK
jgi:hypothetical protein